MNASDNNNKNGNRSINNNNNNSNYRSNKSNYMKVYYVLAIALSTIYVLIIILKIFHSLDKHFLNAYYTQGCMNKIKPLSLRNLF